jgi:hypothetical protein
LGRVEKPALKGSWLGSALLILNPIVKFLLASPLHWPLSRWFLLIEWTGQKTGRAHSTPVSCVRDETGIWVTTGDRWRTFVIGNPSFRVRAGGRWHPARAEIITDPYLSRREHERILSEHGWFRVLAGIPARDGRVDVEALTKAIAAGRTLVKIELDQAADRTRSE